RRLDDADRVLDVVHREVHQVVPAALAVPQVGRALADQALELGRIALQVAVGGTHQVRLRDDARETAAVGHGQVPHPVTGAGGDDLGHGGAGVGHVQRM